VPLLQPLRLEQLVLAAEDGEPLRQLGADALDRALHHVVAGDVVARGIDRDALELPQHPPAERVDLAERLDVSPKSSTRIALPSSYAGKISTTSPRTRNVPRWKS
jgi:hypothetical protein